jgi:hypothetical protein
MTAVGKIWTWTRSYAWAVALFLLGLAVVAVALFLRGEARDLLLGWLDSVRGRHAGRAEALREKAQGLDAQRARLLHEATQLAQERARQEGRELDLARESRALEEEIQGMTAGEVAAAFNTLEGKEP